MARRLQLATKLQQEMLREIYSNRIGPRKSDFENIKQQLRLKMNRMDIEELLLCLATTICDAGHLVRLTEVRTKVPMQRENRHKPCTIRGR